MTDPEKIAARAIREADPSLTLEFIRVNDSIRPDDETEYVVSTLSEPLNGMGPPGMGVSQVERRRRFLLRQPAAGDYEGFERTVRCQMAVDERTDVPVETVYAHSFDDENYERNYCLIDYVRATSQASTWSVDALRPSTAAIGGVLGMLHEEFEFDRYGDVGGDADGEEGELSVVTPAPIDELLRRRPATENAPGWFDGVISTGRTVLSEYTHLVDDAVPRLVHGDTFRRNFMFSEESTDPEMVAVTDWTGAFAGPWWVDLTVAEYSYYLDGLRDGGISETVAAGLIETLRNAYEAQRDVTVETGVEWLYCWLAAALHEAETIRAAYGDPGPQRLEGRYDYFEWLFDAAPELIEAARDDGIDDAAVRSGEWQ